jgi:hypothetical protein
MENNAPPLVGDWATPDFFADEAVLFDFVEGTVRITFSVARTETPVAGSQVGLVSIGRLIMPIAGAQRLSAALHGYLSQRGLDPSQAIRGGETAQ